MKGRAESLRRHLAAAKVERAKFFVDDARHKQITFHDLRATHLTWRAVRAGPSTTIMASVLHTSFQSTLICAQKKPDHHDLLARVAQWRRESVDRS